MRLDEEEVLIRDDSGLLHGGESSYPDRQHGWCKKLTRTLSLSLGFFALGLCFAIPGPTLLDLGDRVQATVGEMMMLFAARSAGYLLGAIVGGVLFDCFDKQLLLFCTLLISSVATIAIPWSLTLIVMALMFGLQGITMGVLDTGGNVFCIRLWGKKSGPYIQTLHFAFGIGAFIAPLLATPFLSNEMVTYNSSLLEGNIPVSPHLLDKLRQNRSSRSDVIYRGNDPLNFDLHNINDIIETKQHPLRLKRDNDDTTTTSSSTTVFSSQQTSASKSSLPVELDDLKSRKSEAINVTDSKPDIVDKVAEPKLDIINKTESEPGSKSLTNNEVNNKVPNMNDITTSTLIKSTANAIIPSNISNSSTSLVGITSVSTSTTSNTEKTVTEAPAVVNKKPSAATDEKLKSRFSDGENIKPHLDEHKDDEDEPTNPNVDNFNTTLSPVTSRNTRLDKSSVTSILPVDGITSLNNVVSSTNFSSNNTNQTTVSKKITGSMNSSSSNVSDSDVTTNSKDDSTITISIVAEKPTTVTVLKSPVTTFALTTIEPTTKTTTVKPTTTETTTETTTSTSASTTTEKLTTTTTTKQPEIVTTHHTTKKISITSEKQTSTRQTPTTSTLREPSTVQINSTAVPPTQISSSGSSESPQVTQISTKPSVTKDSFLDNAIKVIRNISRIQFAYLIIGLVLFFNAVIFLVLYCRDKGRLSAPNDLDDFLSVRNLSGCYRTTIGIMMGVFLLCYMGLEVTYGALVTSFVVDFLHWPKSQGATVAAIFWGSLAAGRGFSIFIARCCGPVVMLSIDLVLMVLGGLVLSIGLYFYAPLVWLGTLILGLGMSSVFPASLTWAENYIHLTGKTTAIFTLGSGLGQIIFPTATGYFFEIIEKMVLMQITAGTSVFLLILFIVIQCFVSGSSQNVYVRERNGFLPLQDEEEENVELDLIHFDKSETRRRRDRRAKGETEYKTLISDLEDD